MDKLFLKNELVTGYNLTPDGVVAYIALRTIMDESIPLYNKTNSVDCVSINRMAYSLIGARETYEKALLDALQRGVYELVNSNALAIVQDLCSRTSYEFLIDFTNMYLDVENDNFVIIYPDEVRKILTCNEIMKKKISMLKYYVALISTFNWSKNMSHIQNMPNLQGKIGAMPIEYIALQADISSRTCIRYNDILSNIKMIYVYKSNDKIKFDDSLKQINNCYSRYEDRELCRLYASNYENAMGYQHKIVKTRKKKEQADNNRRLAQIYNRICDGHGDSYDNATIREVYLYVQNMNKYIQSEIDEKYRQEYMTESDKAWVEKLKLKLRDMSVFEQFDFLNGEPKVSDDQWGEPDSMEHDFSVEEMLDMPAVSEFQPDLAKVTDSDLQSEGDKPKTDGRIFDHETVSQNSPKRY